MWLALPPGTIGPATLGEEDFAGVLDWLSLVFLVVTLFGGSVCACANKDAGLTKIWDFKRISALV